MRGPESHTHTRAQHARARPPPGAASHAPHAPPARPRPHPRSSARCDARPRCTDAGTYLLKLAAEDLEAYKELVVARRGEWGVLSPVQPIERAVDLLCQLLIVQCQGGLARPEGSDLVLTERNAVAAIGRGCALNAGAHLLVAAAED